MPDLKVVTNKSRRESAPTKKGVYIDLAPLLARDRATGNNVCLSLLATYARCLALRDPELSWQAQLMFHEAQRARRGGGTMAMKLGAQLRSFLRDAEDKA